MTESVITCDLGATAAYEAAVESYYSENVLGVGGTCICTHLDRCTQSAIPNTFAAAQLSFVGDNYALRRNGKPWQIVVVSMQTGEVESPIDMVRRREQLADRIPEQFGQRNAHIKGVTSALRVLAGREPGADRGGELLDTPVGPVHLLAAHALVNSTLCSSIKTPGSRAGQGSDVMHRSCAPHLRAVLEILEPTIVHSQGRRANRRHPTPHRSMLDAVDAVEWHDEHVAVATLGKRRFVWVSLAHPSAKGKSAWQHVTSPYLTEVAFPALKRARDLAINLSGR